MSHYNAKKRVYARRRLARQVARLNGGGSLNGALERLRLRYALGKDGWRRWLEGGGALNSNAVTTSADGVPASIATTTWKGNTLTEPAQHNWFDAEGYPLTSRDPETGRFVNPWLSESSNGENGLKKFLRWKFGGLFRVMDGLGLGIDEGSGGDTAKEAAAKGLGESPKLNGGLNERQYSMQSHKTPAPASDILPSMLNTNNQHSQETIQLTWIGHSTTIVHLPGNFTILTDPHFSNYAGPKRRNDPPAMGVADLPDMIDCVLISHDHMDHLDYWSILELIDSNKVKFWVVPLGIKSWFMDRAGVSPEDIVELEWWEGVRISKEPKTKDSDCINKVVLPEVEELVRAFDTTAGEEQQCKRGDSNKHELVITCAPAQHWCSRSPFDRNRRLWCSWAVRATPSTAKSIETTTHSQPRSHSFYFAGDTGLPPEFPLHHQIGDRLGPFDLAAIPIGAYEPNWFMRESHCNPAEAVKIHQAVSARRSVAIHFDTFDLADEPREEPPQLLLKEVYRVNVEIARLAAEVVAVADQVDMATHLGALDGQIGAGDTESNISEVKPSSVVAEVVEMLPPLVDFEVVSRGGSIESLPRN